MKEKQSDKYTNKEQLRFISIILITFSIEINFRIVFSFVLSILKALSLPKIYRQK